MKTRSPSMDIKQLPEGVIFTYDPSHFETVDVLHALAKEAEMELEMSVIALLDKKYELSGNQITEDGEVILSRSPVGQVSGWEMTRRIDYGRRRIASFQQAVDNMKAILDRNVNHWDLAVNKGEFTK